jgi:hypothetical protein
LLALAATVDRSATWALDGSPGFVRLGWAIAPFQRPVDVILEKSVFANVVGMVEHNAVGHFGMNPGSPTYHLAISNNTSDRGAELDATNPWDIRASLDHPDIANILDVSFIQVHE